MLMSKATQNNKKRNSHGNEDKSNHLSKYVTSSNESNPGDPKRPNSISDQ